MCCHVVLSFQVDNSQQSVDGIKWKTKQDLYGSGLRVQFKLHGPYSVYIASITVVILPLLTKGVETFDVCTTHVYNSGMQEEARWAQHPHSVDKFPSFTREQWHSRLTRTDTVRLPPHGATKRHVHIHGQHTIS
jgi:hypothetical protein